MGDTAERRKRVSLRRWHLSKDLLEGRKQARKTSRKRTFQVEETVSPKAPTAGVSLVGKGYRNTIIDHSPMYEETGQRIWTYTQALGTGGSYLWTADIENLVIS